MSTPSQHPQVLAARNVVESLQQRFVTVLTQAARGRFPDAPSFEPRPWLRDDGRHGGGTRYQTGSNKAFDRASVNVSVVHYDDQPDRKLGAAVALSSIVHPRPPRAPSIHLHVSHTSLKEGRAYWRVMADLNPSLPLEPDTARFREALAQSAPAQAEAAFAQGDRYFWIDALQRHRGVVHFYLEAFDTGDFEADRALAERVIGTAIDTYGSLLKQHLGDPVTEADRAAQLAYHTVYLFQVLTLDRGTTSGLMVHGDNDVGILGSLPSHVDPAQLASYADRVPDVQRPLVEGLVAALPSEHPASVTDAVKLALAKTVRDHYRAHPEALRLQAAGNVLPPTVANHARSERGE
ncbi:MAG: coproporphyrinogen III oxidase [Myxococcota bacterium]